MTIDKGMFNFQNVMSQFYNYKPDSDDGKAMKNSFMANMVQSGFDANLAKDMAYTQSGISKENMTLAADLDLRNKTALMNDEFNKGMMSMGGQFEFQNRFAEDQNVRDITKDTTNTATQYEFGNRAQENQNIRDITKDSIERADNFEYTNQINENQSQNRITEDAYSKGAQFDYADKLADNQNIRDMALEGFKGDEYRKNLAATGSQNRLDYTVKGEQERYGMMQQGDESRRTESNRASEQRSTDSNVAEEGRKTIEFSDNIEARKQNRQSARARATARAF
jgi:hypothetical protein